MSIPDLSSATFEYETALDLTINDLRMVFDDLSDQGYGEFELVDLDQDNGKIRLEAGAGSE